MKIFEKWFLFLAICYNCVISLEISLNSTACLSTFLLSVINTYMSITLLENTLVDLLLPGPDA